VVLSVSLLAHAQAPAPRRAPASALPVAPLRLPALPGLSAEQRKELEELHHKTQLQLAPLRAALWLKNEELALLWASESATRELVLQKLSELDIVRQRMREILLEQRFGMIARLTPEQRAAFRRQLGALRPAPQGGKGDLLGLEACFSTGDCMTAPPGAKPR
jgi:hypothetical protein